MRGATQLSSASVGPRHRSSRCPWTDVGRSMTGPSRGCGTQVPRGPGRAGRHATRDEAELWTPKMSVGSLSISSSKPVRLSVAFYGCRCMRAPRTSSCPRLRSEVRSGIHSWTGQPRLQSAWRWSRIGALVSAAVSGRTADAACANYCRGGRPPSAHSLTPCGRPGSGRRGWSSPGVVLLAGFALWFAFSRRAASVRANVERARPLGVLAAEARLERALREVASAERSGTVDDRALSKLVAGRVAELLGVDINETKDALVARTTAQLSFASSAWATPRPCQSSTTATAASAVSEASLRQTYRATPSA